MEIPLTSIKEILTDPADGLNNVQIMLHGSKDKNTTKDMNYDIPLCIYVDAQNCIVIKGDKLTIE